MRLSRSIPLMLALVLAVPATASAASSAASESEKTITHTESAAVERRFEQAALTQPMPDSIARAHIAANPPVCEGDGTSGKRVEVLYLYNTGKPSRYGTFLLSMRAMLSMVDDVYNDSARRYGESRHIRFVTQANGTSCDIAIREIGLAPGVIGDAGAARAAIEAMGYNKPGRDYLMLGDPKVADSDPDVCGVAWGDNDERPGPENRFNTGPYYARVDHLCWGSNAIAHELGHAFGAVLPFAPHFDGGGHCSDEWDVMCYGPSMNYPCTELDSDRLLDCNGDDYFNPSPAAGTPLATHWNVANNEFLIRGPAEPESLRTGYTYAITNQATGEALDVTDASAAEWARLTTRPRTDAANQRWTIDYATGYRLLNNNSGLCVESIFSGTTPGTEIMQYRCHEGNASKWTFHQAGNGSFALLHDRSGLALTPSGTGPAVLQPYTGAANQQWTLNRLTVADPQPGTTYHLRAYRERNGIVDAIEVQGDSTSPGALLIRNTPSDSAGQRWQLQATSTADRWRLVSSRSGLCARPQGGSTAAGVPVEQWTCDSSTIQQWRLARAEDGRYMVFNRVTGSALKLNDGAGSNLVVQPATGDANLARSMILWLKPAT